MAGKTGKGGIRIVILVEGKTEKAFKPVLVNFLEQRLPGKMPKLRFCPYDGRIPMREKLWRVVRNHLAESDAVIALTDVYTGGNDFADAEDAKAKMREWVGNEPCFHPHVAQHDFEAWLLPFWRTILKLSGADHKAPSGSPEQVNHGNPPAHRIKAVFEARKSRESYQKPRDGLRILRENDLLTAAQVCPELKSFLNTILGLCSGELIG